VGRRLGRTARSKRWLIAVAVVAAGPVCLVAVLPASAQREVEKVVRVPARKQRAASLVTIVKPGDLVRWQSPRIGFVQRLSLVVNGREMAYKVKPNTNACVAYSYGAGVAIRPTDCEIGRQPRRGDSVIIDFEA
jgi:hypothetical protein